jgi:hypothetical protein
MRQAVEPVHSRTVSFVSSAKNSEIGKDRVVEAASLQAFDVMFVSWRCFLDCAALTANFT